MGFFSLIWNKNFHLNATNFRIKIFTYKNSRWENKLKCNQGKIKYIIQTDA